MSILSNEAACMECTHGERAFMHGKGFIKFEVAFQFFLEKEIKALQNISLFDVWNVRSQDHFG
jgi:hypothetical protein